ncbi:MAG TPA: STAS domain-containing protein [Rectinemataceae bacterium]|nr:STAS domain-containing protein [Rectinemataceae bacterium]
MNEGDGSIIRLRPEGALCIERAAYLKSAILEGLEKGGPVELDFSAVEDIDLPCLQVLVAARREAMATGRGFRLSGSLSQRVVRKIRASGFVSSIPESGADLEKTLVGWLGEGK